MKIPAGVYEVAETIKRIPQTIIKNIDENRLKVNLSVQCWKDEFLKFVQKIFFTTLLGFTYKECPITNLFGNGTVKTTGTKRSHLELDCIFYRKVKYIRKPILIELRDVKITCFQNISRT